MSILTLASASSAYRGYEYYTANKVLLFTKIGTLVGYTSATVSVKRGMRTYVYDARGSLKFSRA